MRNFKKSAALAIIYIAAGCGKIGTETVRADCGDGFVYNATGPQGAGCYPIENDGGTPVDPNTVDGDHDTVTPANGDCDDTEARVSPLVTRAQASAACEDDRIGLDGADIDCDGVVDCVAECGSASDCNDANSCTADRCVGGTCLHARDAACEVVCEDDIACTRDARSGDRCEYVPDDALCGAGFRCDPASGCVAVPPDREPACRRDADCNDDLVCNGIEQCEDGECVRGEPVRCPDPGGCLVAACDDFAGGCVQFPDFWRCGGGEACDPDLGECVFIGECRVDSECDDGNRCNGIERCGPDFECRRGFPVVCEDGNPRTVDLCVPSDGTCTHTPSGRCLNHSDCDDGRFCTGVETCNASGTCLSGTPIACAARSGFTAVCDDALRGCVYERGDSGCEPGTTSECASSCGTTGRRICAGDRTWGACMAPAESCATAVDDDCDGLVNEGCVVCAPSSEICNLRDDDCDGLTDEGTVECGVGSCRRSVQMCVGGVSQSCIPGSPNSEICSNGIDEDCDGTADDGCGGVVVPAADQTTVRNLCFDVLEASFPGGSCTPSGWTAVIWQADGSAMRSAPGGEACISTVGYRRGGYVEFSAQCNGVYYDTWSVGRRCSDLGCVVRADGVDRSSETTVVGRNPRYYLP